MQRHSSAARAAKAKAKEAPKEKDLLVKASVGSKIHLDETEYE